MFDGNNVLVTTSGIYYPITWVSSGLSSGLSLDPSTGEITLGSDGIYLVLFSGSIEINSTVNEVDVKLFSNGSVIGNQAWAYAPSVSSAIPSAYPTIGFNYIHPGVNGDILTLRVTDFVNGKTIAFASSQISVVKIG